MRVLFVCTANICRSALAAGLLVDAAAQRDLGDLRVASAGFLPGGRQPHDSVLQLLDESGVDLSEKRSRRLDETIVGGAQLILTMTSEHARRLVGEFPASAAKVWVLRDFCTVVTARAEGQSIDSWLGALSELHHRSYAEDSERLDVPDPIGEAHDAFVTLSEELTNLIGWFLACAYPARS